MAAVFSVSDEAGLAQAIIDANATPELDIIILNADINLNTTTPYVFEGNNGLPPITAPLKILGNNYTIRRTSETQFRLMVVDGTDLWLENLTLARGDSGSFYGGAIYVYTYNGPSSLTLYSVTIGGSPTDGNTSSRDGGGIYSNGNLTIIDSLISYNQTTTTSTYGSGSGGGVFTRSGSTVISNTIFSNNISLGEGGGLAIEYVSPIIIFDNTFNNNEAGQGGGLWILNTFNDTETNIWRTTFDSNISGSSGGQFAFLEPRIMLHA